MNVRLILSVLLTSFVLEAPAWAQQPRAMNLDTVTKTVVVNGLSFPVVDHGSGPPVLLLHGFPDNRHMWRYQVGPLAAAGYRVIAPDLRGFGDAPRPQDPKEYSRPHLMGDVLGILDALGVKEKVQLVAHDHGAGLGWRLMAEHGDRFDRYVALSVGAPGGATTVEQREKSWYTALFRQPGTAEDELKKDNWKLFREWARHSEAERWVTELSRPGALTAGLNWYRAPAASPNPPVITRPVLAIWSDGDAYLTEPRVKSSGERIAGPFRYEKIAGASHWMMLDKPEELNRLLLGFFTKTPNARPAPFDIEAHTKSVRVGAMTFPVVDHGTGAPVLLLHGFPDSRHLWRYQIGPLAAAGFRVIAPDLRGFGDAPRPQDAKEYARPLLMADVLGILDALGMKRVQIVAHDHGAGLAWRLVAEHPDRFERYVALSVGAPGGATPIEQREKSWYGALFRQAGFAEEELQRDNWKLFRDWARNPVEIDSYIRALSRPGALTSGLNWYRAPAAADAPPVTIPVLGIWSDGDAYLTEYRMKTSGERMKGPFRYERISGASHWMMIDKPEELNTLLIGFLRGQATGGEARGSAQISDWKGTTVRLEEGDVMSNGVRIHYHTAGEGPLVILIHGIGGFWFDWRHQIPALATRYKVVAMTQRGFNQSDQPVGVEQYSVEKIAGDIDALIRHFGREKATIMAYDSGGFHAWYFAMHYPQKTERLVAIGSYHPATLVREYATNPAQQKAGQYSRNYQEQPDAAANMAKQRLDPNAPPRAGDTPEVHRMRMEAYKRSSFDAMVNFYKANWPRAPYSLDMRAVGGKLGEYPKVTSPTLVVYGREDVPLVVNGLNDLWHWVDNELTLLVVPGAGHGPHAEVPDFTTPRIMDWLAGREHPALMYPRAK